MKIITTLFVLLLLVLFFPFYISISVKKEDEKDVLMLGLKIFKVIKLNYEISLIDLISSENKIVLGFNRKTNISRNNISLRMENVNHYYNKFKESKRQNKVVIDYILKKIKFINLKAVFKVGFEDAAITAIITGFLWSILYMILSILFNYKEIEDYNVDITAEFNKSIFQVDFNCIIKLKLVYIIIAGYKSAKVKIKGGVTNV